MMRLTSESLFALISWVCRALLIKVSIATALAFAGMAHAQLSMQEALEQGKVLGTQQNTGASERMQQGSLQDKLPGYAPSPSEADLFADGNGNTKAAGNEKAAGCAGADVAGLSGYAGKPCDAINFLRAQPTSRPDMAIGKTDPLVRSASGAIANAKADGLTAGVGFATEQPTCTTTTVPGETQYVNEVCHSDGTLSQTSCTTKQVIDVQKQFNYRCTSTPKALEEVSCERVLNTVCTAAQVTLVCPGGLAPRDGQHCEATEEVNEAAVIAHSCPSGSTLSGTSCVSTQSVSAAVSGYTCPSGFTLNGTACERQVTDTQTATPVYSCPAGQTLSGSSCTGTDSVSASVAAYTCPAGATVSGSSCLSVQSISPTTSNTCPSGYTLVGSSCQRTVSTSATPSYACASGYTLSGSTCKRPTTSPADVASYTCSTGYTLSGSSCSRTTTTTAASTPVYACDAGYTLSGTSCSRQISAAATPTYSCREGGTLNGAQCTYIVTTTSDATEQFACDEAAGGELTQGAVVGGKQTYVCCAEEPNNQCAQLEGEAL